MLVHEDVRSLVCRALIGACGARPERHEAGQREPVQYRSPVISRPRVYVRFVLGERARKSVLSLAGGDEEEESPWRQG